ncbi:MAG: M24 family metallopeptidase, partial [Actinomyces sp.]
MSTAPDPDRGPRLPEVGSLPPITVEGRVARLRARLADEGIDAFATVDPVSRRWLSGFTGSSGLLLVADRVTLFTDGRYGEQARAELARAHSSAAVEVVSDPVAAAAGRVTGGRLALEADRITWAEQRRWAEACPADLVAWTGVVDEMRAVKSPAEVARMAAAAAIASAALAEVLDEGVEGRTEREIAAALDAAMARRGADGPAYDTIV